MPPVKTADGGEPEPLQEHADAGELAKAERRKERDRERKRREREAKAEAKAAGKDAAPKKAGKAKAAPDPDAPPEPPPLPPELEKAFRESIDAFLQAGAALPFYVMARRKDDVRWLLEEKEVVRNAAALEYWAEYRLPQILELLRRYPELLVVGCFGASALPRLRMGPPADTERLSFVVAAERARQEQAQKDREEEQRRAANGGAS